MSRRILVVALAALCAVALSAVASSGASAAETTAYTCVEGAPQTFQTEDCTGTYSSGVGYHHVEIPANTSTVLSLTSLKNPVLSSTIALAAVELEATGVECVSCTAANSGSAGAMKVSGTGGKLKFSGVTVKKKTTECVVKSVPGGVAGEILSEKLKVETTGTAEAVISPESTETGAALAKFEIVAASGKTCSLTGSYKVTGSAKGTTNGAILTVNVAKSSGELKLSGEPAGLTGEATIKAGATAAALHPTALT